MTCGSCLVLRTAYLGDGRASCRVSAQPCVTPRFFNTLRNLRHNINNYTTSRSSGTEGLLFYLFECSSESFNLKHLLKPVDAL